ncbi:MAG: hypothetical protein OCD01_13635 [Fibrobacterales bacterium]
MHIKIITSFLLLISLFATSPQAECVGCGVELLYLPIAFSVVSGVTSAVPMVFQEDNEDYSYLRTYALGFSGSIAGVFIGFSTTDYYPKTAVFDELLGGFSGLLLGNALGYYTSKSTKVPSISLRMNPSGSKGSITVILSM